jgi:hypothetical protein
VARDAAGGVGGTEEGRAEWLGRAGRDWRRAGRRKSREDFWTPHQRPAGCLEIRRHIVLAPLQIALFDRRWLLASAPFAHSTVEDHVSTVIGERMLEIRVCPQLSARHDEEQCGHDCAHAAPVCASEL